MYQIENPLSNDMIQYNTLYCYTPSTLFLFSKVRLSKTAPNPHTIVFDCALHVF